MEGIKRREGKDGEVQVGVDGWKRGGGCMDKDGEGGDYE